VESCDALFCSIKSSVSDALAAACSGEILGADDSSYAASSEGKGIGAIALHADDDAAGDDWKRVGRGGVRGIAELLA
jgi:hypothetical protein